jgi:hypothetical protein
MSVAGDQLYQLIKTDESQFPIPAPYVTVNVGTFNAASGTFSGLTTTVDFDPEPIEHSPKQHPINPAPKYQGSEWVSITINSRWQRTITSTPAPIVPLAPILLQFSVENYASAWSVAANGITANAAAGQTSLTLSIWDATIVNWGITVGESFYKDTVRIQRPAGLVDFGAGAFTIPVIPCTVVYAPPADSLGLSVASYLSGQTIGTSLTTSFSSDSSTTSQSTTGKYADADSFVSVLDITSQSLDLFKATLLPLRRSSSTQIEARGERLRRRSLRSSRR